MTLYVHISRYPALRICTCIYAHTRTYITAFIIKFVITNVIKRYKWSKLTRRVCAMRCIQSNCSSFRFIEWSSYAVIQIRRWQKSNNLDHTLRNTMHCMCILIKHMLWSKNRICIWWMEAASSSKIMNNLLYVPTSSIVSICFKVHNLLYLPLLSLIYKCHHFMEQKYNGNILCMVWSICT